MMLVYTNGTTEELKGNLCGVDNDVDVDDENGCESIVDIQHTAHRMKNESA
jgi:hypothetical protein